jgi:hypothetical protein
MVCAETDTTARTSGLADVALRAASSALSNVALGTAASPVWVL